MAFYEEEEESKWDWWPALSGSGVQVTVSQARITGLHLAQRSAKYLEAGAPLLKKRDYESAQDNRTLQDCCNTGQCWLPHEVMVALLEHFTAPRSAGGKFWRQDSPVLKYLDWRKIAMGCWGDRRAGATQLPLGESI
eukprot:859974-Amphidinium_carterae.1